ncbi:MAG TPA: NAD-binding protein [Streptosporangiaceae bacterium]|nr:NAD-binding protein [Streptosporangiaceae bacterium]
MWLDRAVPTVPRRISQSRDHLIVCGDDALTCRIVEELTASYGERVTVLLPDRERGQGPRISRLPGVRVIERRELDSDAFNDAQVQTARALALLSQDDLGNFHAALRAQEINPDLRLVVAIFNAGLGERMRSFFRDCAVLSGSAMAAPSFVAAALGEPAPSHVRLAGRTLYLARRELTDPDQVICGLAMTSDAASPQIVAGDATAADLVLAVADGAPRDPLARKLRPLRATWNLTRRLLLHKFGVVFLTLFAVLVGGFALLATAAGFSPANALYLTFLDAAGAAVTDPALSTPEKIAQFMLTFDGMAFLPVVTAAVVGARLTGTLRSRDRPVRDHVIVAGLGNVGTRILGQLHDLGVEVVCVDKSENAAGVQLARRLRLRVVIGETHREETLRAAGIGTCQALVSVTNSDIVNLETALQARALAADLRLVLRLGDDDLAARVQETVGNTISRSVPYLAAPAFAATMLEHQVLRTIPVGRHVLLIADVSISAGSELSGRPVDTVHQTGLVRVIAVRYRVTPDIDWSPRRDRLLTPGDRIYVLATRAGLRQVLARSEPADPDPIAM